jgi:next-to-BRCA1 protein 1
MTPAPTMTPNVGILDARFVSDITIPDGYVVRPGESFQKIWEIRNEGEVAWPEGTVFQHVNGPTFGPVESVSLRPREPGETAEIAVDMVAPSEPGLHTSYWQLCIGSQCFGSRFWVQIRVQAEE